MSSKENSNFHRLIQLLSGQSSGKTLEVATVFLSYQAHLNQFHKNVSRVKENALTFGELKKLFGETVADMAKVKDNKDSFSLLIDQSRQKAESEEGLISN